MLVLATVYKEADQMKGLYAGWDKDVHFVASEDFFQTPETKTVPCGVQFEITSGVVLLGISNACPVDIYGVERSVSESMDRLKGVTLHVSTDAGQTFHEACVPVALQVWPIFLTVASGRFLSNLAILRW